MIPRFRNYLAISILLIGLTSPSARAADPIPPDSLSALQARLHEIVGNPRYEHALWGVKIADLKTGKVLFEENPTKLFSPASNSKLYSMATALDRLGPDYKIRTSIYAKAKPNDSGVIEGDLIVYGRGDPTINLKLHNGSIYEALQPLVAALTNAGVRQIAGDLIGDESYFHGPPFGSGWDWDDLQYYYGAEVSSLTINDNTLVINVKPGAKLGDNCKVTFIPPTDYVMVIDRTETGAAGSRKAISLYRPVAENLLYVTGTVPADATPFSDDVTMHNPAGLFIRFFKEALARNGITISGRERTMDWMDREIRPLELKELTEVGYQESLPMRDILKEVLKPSQNLYTDLILDHVGMVQQGDKPLGRGETSEDAGIHALNAFLKEAGVPPGQTLFNEGSGLSRNNLTTPNATVTLLEFMSRHKNFQAYYDALPVAGVDGTLRRRMKGTPAEGNVHAKTGTLSAANSLSGYVTTAAGEKFVFSIMLNRFHNTDATRSRTTDVDGIAALLASFTGHVE